MALTFTCTTLGPTCEATLATGSFAGIRGEGFGTDFATFSVFGPGSDVMDVIEQPEIKTVSSTASVNEIGATYFDRLVVKIGPLWNPELDVLQLLYTSTRGYTRYSPHRFQDRGTLELR